MSGELSMPARGLSLVEIMMAVLVMGVTLLAAAESLSSVATLADLNERRFDVQREAETIVAEVGSDLSSSGWYFPSFLDDEYQVTTAAEDREKVYYPYVLQQSTGFDAGSRSGGRTEGLPAAVAVMDDPSWATALPTNPADPGFADRVDANFDHFRRDGRFVDLGAHLPEGLPGNPADDQQNFTDAIINDDDRLAAYRESFYARSQELIFLRATNAEWERDPDLQAEAHLDFSGPDNDWEEADPVAVQNFIRSRETAYLSAGESPLLARFYAEQDAVENATFFRHAFNGVLRMGEYDLNLVNLNPGDPSNPVFEWRPWDRGPTAPSDKRYVDPIVVPGAWMTVSSGLEFNLNVRWETKYPFDNLRVRSIPGSSRQRILNNHLREFSYLVVPSPLPGGSGRLLRAYSVDLDDGDGDGNTDSLFAGLEEGVEVGNLVSSSADGRYGCVVDKVLSDHVARVVFDTYRSDPEGALDLNQVRMRLYLSTGRDHSTGGSDGPPVIHRVEHIFTLRAGNNDQANDRNLVVLGDQRLPLDY